MFSMSKKNNNGNTKIIGIDNINIITNGTLDEFKNITNPNQVGKVINTDNNEVVNEITPMIMIINQGNTDYKERLNIMMQNGGNMDQVINYNGGMSPREIAVQYRNF